jgi:3-oxoacyl-[acyl-carrier protein] reductase
MTTPQRELEGQVALVTGAALNIGRAICRALADAGARVAINAKTSVAQAQQLAEEIGDSGGEAMAHIADVSDPDAVEAMVAAVVERFGKLTILVNNATYRGLVPLAEMTLEKWRMAQSVTVEGTFLCSQAAIPEMRRAGGGTIVNMGGVAGYVGVKDRLHAATAKAAVAGMTRSLAHEVAGDGITVNCVSPGVIETVRGAAAGELPPGMTGTDNLLGRAGRPEEVAAMVRALCGPAGRYVTGQVLHVNGGKFLAP